MPHSVSPEDTTRSSGHDEVMEEGVVVGDEAMAENASEVPQVKSEEIHTNGNDGQDAIMSDTQEEIEAAKAEVKLEDLFADVESDEEFPSSGVQEVKTEAEPPLSPV